MDDKWNLLVLLLVERSFNLIARLVHDYDDTVEPPKLCQHGKQVIERVLVMKNSRHNNPAPATNRTLDSRERIKQGLVFLWMHLDPTKLLLFFFQLPLHALSRGSQETQERHYESDQRKSHCATLLNTIQFDPSE